MDRLAEDYKEQVHFVFVYVRETHPDTHPEWPAHKTLEQKFAHARALRDRYKTPRTIVVDTLEGMVHRLYGGMPNMSWIVDRAGIVTWKADWTVASDLAVALEEVLALQDMKREGGASLYYKETISINPHRRA